MHGGETDDVDGGDVICMSASREGAFLATVTSHFSHSVSLWDLHKERQSKLLVKLDEPISCIRMPAPATAATDAQSLLLLGTGGNGTVLLMDLGSGKELARLQVPHEVDTPAEVTCIDVAESAAVAGDEAGPTPSLAAAYIVVGCADGGFHRWRLQKGGWVLQPPMSPELTHPGGPVSCVSLARRAGDKPGLLLASCCVVEGRAMLRVWEQYGGCQLLSTLSAATVPTALPLAPSPDPAFTCVALVAGGTLLVAGDGSGMVALYDADSGVQLPGASVAQLGSPVHALAVSADGRTVSVSLSQPRGLVYLLSVSAAGLSALGSLDAESGASSSMCMSANGKCVVVSAGSDLVLFNPPEDLAARQGHHTVIRSHLELFATP